MMMPNVNQGGFMMTSPQPYPAYQNFQEKSTSSEVMGRPANRYLDPALQQKLQKAERK